MTGLKDNSLEQLSVSSPLKAREQDQSSNGGQD